MLSIYLGLLALALILLAIWGARRENAVLRVIVLAQVAYWAISYFVRPLILLAYNPQPHIGDPIADPRFAVGGYGQTLTHLLPIVVVGLWSYLAVIVLLNRSWPIGAVASQDFSQGWLLVWLTGWFARAIQLTTGNAGGVVSTLALLAPVGIGLLILRPAQRRVAPSTWLILLSGEAAYCFLTASKTPIVAMALMLVIRQTVKGWSTKSWTYLAVASFAAVLAFGTFQSFKLGQTDTQNFSASLDANYPTAMHPVVQVVRRLDQLSAVGDAYYVIPGGWITPSETVKRLLISTVPQPIAGSKLNAGARWNLEVRSRSDPSAATSSVSLADGFIAEGYAIGGYAGVIVEASLLAGIALLVTAFASSPRRLLRTWGLGVLAFPVLFERGLLGAVEMLSKTFQVAVVASVICIIVAELRSSKFRQGTGLERVG